MSKPLATILIVPRERFSAAIESLDTLIEITSEPYELIYVDVASPRRVRKQIERRCRERGFRYLRHDGYLAPNQMRNLGLPLVTTKYVVFLDNDVFVRPGWLARLVACAEETGAWIVGPLYLEGEPPEETIHMAGGTVMREEKDGVTRLWIDMHLKDTPLSDLEAPLVRTETDNVEFHGLLACMDAFESIGPLDEKLLTTREPVDLCLSVQRAGGSVWLEPSSMISYSVPKTFTWADLRYNLWRWNADAALSPIEHFQNKWGVKVETKRVSNVASRRRHAVLHYLFGSLGLVEPLRRVKRAIVGPRA